jgi:hypothetical protein
VTVISWSASELTSVTLLVWSAAVALNEAPPKMDAIAIESFEFIVHPSTVFLEVPANPSVVISSRVERAINHCDISR